jgi:hypothetical protein
LPCGSSWPTKSEFVHNLTTVRALVIDVPPRLLAIADEVIKTGGRPRRCREVDAAWVDEASSVGTIERASMTVVVLMEVRRASVNGSVRVRGRTRI